MVRPAMLSDRSRSRLGSQVRAGVGEGEVLGPGEQVRGEGKEFEPDLVGGEVVQRQVAQSGVFQAAGLASLRVNALGSLFFGTATACRPLCSQSVRQQ
jgi:hypothetical protein